MFPWIRRSCACFHFKLYIHPNAVPSDNWKVRKGYPAMDTAMWSWAPRTGGHAMRLILGGVFDRYPNARVILGHMGEFLPFQLSRLDSRFEVLDFEHPLEKLPSEYFRTNIAITTTGVFSHAALVAAIQEAGASCPRVDSALPAAAGDVRTRRLALTGSAVSFELPGGIGRWVSGGLCGR